MRRIRINLTMSVRGKERASKAAHTIMRIRCVQKTRVERLVSTCSHDLKNRHRRQCNFKSIIFSDKEHANTSVGRASRLRQSSV